MTPAVDQGRFFASVCSPEHEDDAFLLCPDGLNDLIGEALPAAALVDRRRHVILESAHPSPLAAYRGFFGSRPFSAANAALEEAGRSPIDWRLATPATPPGVLAAPQP